MFQMLGVFAEFERALTQERVRAGLARARSEGKRLGRPHGDAKGKSASGSNREAESTDAPERGGLLRISAEAG